MVFMENQTGTELSGVIVKVGVNDGRLKIGPSDTFLPGFLDDCALLCFARASRSDYASLSCTSKRFYRLLGSDVLYELRKRLGIVEHWVFLVCDPMQWEAFDPLRDRWMTLPKIPSDECFSLSDKESLAVDYELLVFGVELNGLTIWKFSMIRRRWVKCEAMHQPRCLFGSGSFGTLAIVAGGCDQKGNILQSAELYDSKTGRWEILPDLHSPRKMCSGFFMDGKFYVIGGMSGPGASLTFGEEFDFETWTWRKIEGMYPDVNRASEAPPLVAVVENELYAVERSTNMVKKYDKEKNTWDVLGRLPIRADVSFGWGLAFKACGNQLLVIGGERGFHGAATVVNSWSPKSGVSNGSLDWKVLGAKNLGSVFVYNCAVMGC